MNSVAGQRAGTASLGRGRPRRRAFTVLVALVAFGTAGLFALTTALTVGLWFTDPAYVETNPVVDLGFLALGGVLVAGGLATQLRSPARHVAALQQAVLALLALTVAGLLGGRVEPFVGGLVLLLATAAAAFLHPVRDALLHRTRSVSRPLAALTIVAAGPGVAYAVAMLELARDAGPSCFAGQCARGDRFAEAAALAIAVVAVTGLASLRTSGWKGSARFAAVAAAILGLASIALPAVPGSVGPVAGAGVVLWAVAVAGVAEWEGRGAAAH